MVQFSYAWLYLGTETIFCRLLQRVAKMDMDWNLTKLGQRFQRFQRLQKSITPKKIIMVSAPWWNFFDIFSITLQEHFVYG